MSLESVTPTPPAPGVGPSQVQVSVCVGGCCLCVPFSLVSGPLLCPTPHEPLGAQGGGPSPASLHGCNGSRGKRAGCNDNYRGVMGVLIFSLDGERGCAPARGGCAHTCVFAGSGSQRLAFSSSLALFPRTLPCSSRRSVLHGLSLTWAWRLGFKPWLCLSLALRPWASA